MSLDPATVVKIKDQFEELQALRVQQFTHIRELVEIAYANLPGARHELYACIEKYETPGSDWYDGHRHEPCQSCRCRAALKSLLDVLPELGRKSA